MSTPPSKSWTQGRMVKLVNFCAPWIYGHSMPLNKQDKSKKNQGALVVAGVSRRNLLHIFYIPKIISRIIILNKYFPEFFAFSRTVQIILH